jgi:hypothetical protein
MEHLDLDNLDHDSDLANALGNMVVAWARAETVLVTVFAHVTGLHFNMATPAYYRIPTFEARSKVILALLPAWETKEKERRDKLIKAVEKLSALAATRNGWIHSVWCVIKGTSDTVIFDFRKPDDAPGRRRAVKAHDVRDHVRAVLERTEAIEALVPLKINKVVKEKP